ncbi:MAG: FecR family protein [Bacteroidota bacterium]
MKKEEKPKKEQEVDIKLIKKFLNKKCTPNEHESVLKWFTQIRYERKLKNIIREHWNEFKLESPDYKVDTNPLLDKLHHFIHLDSYKKSRNLSLQRKVFKQLRNIAAVLFLPVLIFSASYFLTGRGLFTKVEKTIYAEIYSPPSARTSFELSDGSTGWLNSGSTLKFPVRFKGKTREVRLKGEGFFNVVKDPENPFVVKTSDLNIKALGTRFNVWAYPDDKSSEVTLESGKVIVEKVRENGGILNYLELQPGHHLTISQKGFVKRTVETEKYTSWKEGKLILRNDPMSEVVKRIGRWYNVEIKLRDKELENYRYRATFEEENFREVLKLLKLTSPIDYVEEERELLPDGTFTRKKITLFIKQGYEETLE